jgi:microcystin-dependent protein
MPLESGATYLPDLVPANPGHTDPQAQGDAHIRLIKSVLQNTFKNFTSAALNSTQSAIDAAVAAVTGGTVTVGAGTAVAPALAVGTGTLHPPGLHSPSIDHIAIATAGVDAIVVNADQSVNFAGAVAAAGNLAVAGSITGLGALPIGTPLMWLTGTPPTGYLWLNGQLVSRTTYAALFLVFGTFFGVGDGSTTFALPDLREVVPFGVAGMGGTGPRPSGGIQSSLGVIPNGTNWNVVGSVLGGGSHTLTLAEAPTGQFTFNFNDPSHSHTLNFATNIVAASEPAVEGSVNASTGSASGAVNPSGTGITASITDHAGGGAHNIMQPSIAVSWIVKAF